MTRKDYEAAAAIIRDYRTQGIKDSEALRAAQAFIRLFKPDNPRFNVDRFLAACEPELTEASNEE